MQQIKIKSMVGASMLLAGTSGAFAGTILTFQAQTNPGASNPPEIEWNAQPNPGPLASLPSLQAGNPTNPGYGGTGSLGNGDGASLSNGLAPGLNINTPFSITPGASLGEHNNTDGSTSFYDVTFVLTGLTPSAMAGQDNNGLDYQPLSGGTFAFYGSHAGGGSIAAGGPGVLLLSGTLVDTATNGLDQFDVGAQISLMDTSVTYTGGLIYNALVAQNEALSARRASHSTWIRVSQSRITAISAISRRTRRDCFSPPARRFPSRDAGCSWERQLS